MKSLNLFLTLNYMLICRICRAQFNSLNDIISHLRYYHGIEKNYERLIIEKDGEPEKVEYRTILDFLFSNI